MVINCAFIGFGKSTTRYHLPYVLNRKDSWHVAHIFRRHAKPEEQAPIYSHIHFTSDLDEVLNDPDVKLVVVCTHADSHFEYAKRALEAGKNVLVEKPFTPTLAQAKELFALAKSKGLTVTPYQNRRFDSCFLTAKKAIESGKLGEIVEVESHFVPPGGRNQTWAAAGWRVLWPWCAYDGPDYFSVRSPGSRRL